MSTKKNNTDTGDREIKISRLLNAPIELVWEVWTNPDHIKNWWGPNGFKNTITKMDIHQGGGWNLIMHGPDGTDYENESIFTEVEWQKKLSYKHISGHEFIAVILFEKTNEQTYIRWQMLFETKEELNRIMSQYDISEGLKQNVDKLEFYLKNQSAKWNQQTATQQIEKLKSPDH